MVSRYNRAKLVLAAAITACVAAAPAAADEPRQIYNDELANSPSPVYGFCFGTNEMFVKSYRTTPFVLETAAARQWAAHVHASEKMDNWAATKGYINPLGYNDWGGCQFYKTKQQLDGAFYMRGGGKVDTLVRFDFFGRGRELDGYLGQSPNVVTYDGGNDVADIKPLPETSDIASSDDTAAKAKAEAERRAEAARRAAAERAKEDAARKAAQASANSEVLERGAQQDAQYKAELARVEAAQAKYKADRAEYERKKAAADAADAEYRKKLAAYDAVVDRSGKDGGAKPDEKPKPDPMKRVTDFSPGGQLPGFLEWHPAGSKGPVDFYYSYAIDKDEIRVKWNCVNNSAVRQTCSVGSATDGKKYDCLNSVRIIGHSAYIGESMDVAPGQRALFQADYACKGMGANGVTAEAAVDIWKQ